MKISLYQSVALALVLGGCGSVAKLDSNKGNETTIELKKVSPFVSQTLTPSELIAPETGEKDTRANENVTISINHNTFEKGNTATVTLTDMPRRYDWIGLFHKGDESKRENLLTYSWTGDFKQGSKGLKIANTLNRHTINGLPDGEYEIRAFTKSGKYIELARTSIKVQKDDSSEFNPTVTLDKNTYYAGQMIPISLHSLAEFGGEWVGIFPRGSDNDWENALEWEWTEDAKNGHISLHDVAAGEYDIRVFYDEDMELETSIKITIQENDNLTTNISTDKTIFSDSERITINFSGMPGNDDDWIGIFPKNADNDKSNALTLEWTNGQESGSVSLDSVEEGDYEIRAFHSGDSDSVYTLDVTISNHTPHNKKVALFADEHDPYNRLLAIDYENMELIEEVSVNGSLTHHADVVGNVDTANNILMIPKGSTHINVYTVNDRKFVKKINLPFKPRSADAFNSSKNLVLLPSSNRPAAVLIDANKWNIVGTVGMNVSCDLKFNYSNNLPWYYKQVVYKSYNINDISCSAPDFGGSQISGHPIWLDNNYFSVLDRANRLIHVYKLTSKDSNGKWRTKLTDVFHTSTSLHQMVPSGLNDNIFYGMTEGNGNNKGIAPVMYKWKFKNGKLIKLNETSLVTTKTISLMQSAGCYNLFTNYWNQYKNAQNYYSYYYPTRYSSTYRNYYPGSYSNYFNKYYNRYNTYFNKNIQQYKSYYTKNVPTTIQKQFNSLGGHNLYISPEVNGKQYLWGAVASGQTFVVDTESMSISSVVKSDKGAGHVNFQEDGDYAVITNHKSRNVTIANYKTQKFVKNVSLPYNKENIFAVLQSHAPYITKDDQYFHNSWTDGGVFFRINLNTLTLDTQNVYTGGIPIQGNYFPNYQGD